MKKITILLSILLLEAVNSNAQSTPGYLGKRMQIGYQGNIFPSFVNPNGEEVNDKASLNYQSFLHFDYALSKKWGASVKLGYFSTYANPDGFIWSIADAFERNFKISTTSVSAGLKRFRQHFAPLGTYWEFKTALLIIKAGDLYYPETKQYNDPGGLVVSGSVSSAFAVGLGYGMNRVIYDDKLMISTGIELSYTFVDREFAVSMMDHSTSADPVNGGNTESNQMELMDVAKGRVFIHNLLNFKVGVSYLL